MARSRAFVTGAAKGLIPSSRLTSGGRLVPVRPDANGLRSHDSVPVRNYDGAVRS
ncbi:hypothetical protein [Actinophytocola glycyrrhizae]|uniref:Uncharacterized protein n=1 Tax=Actinophytocola glycyrrhizae TaxID=2044873 RepID=A0ABV9RVR2_9PSEU